jgi:hypothetical protein
LTIGFVFFQLLNISLCQIFRAPFAVVTPDHSSVQINAVSAA